MKKKYNKQNKKKYGKGFRHLHIKNSKKNVDIAVCLIIYNILAHNSDLLTSK